LIIPLRYTGEFQGGPQLDIYEKSILTVSRIFKELHHAEIKKVVSNLYGSDTRIIDCCLLKGGVFNTTYLVKTNNERNGIVLRVAPINRHLLFDFEKSMMAAEPLFYQMLQDKNIPTSEVIHYDNSFKVIDREYIIFKYIRSIPLNDISVPKEVKAGLYQRLGEIIALLHDIKSEKFGWKRPNSDLDMYDNWGAFIQRFAKEIAARASSYGIFSDVQISRFINIFIDTTEFDKITQACMVHADLWEGNVLVRENEGKWEIVALIDVDKAIFGDKDLEFASPTMLNDDFLRGYGSRAAESLDSIFRRNAYKLLESFMYAYIWFAQFENQERYELAKREGLATLDLFESS
jgi:aminoglycoside phosphotransferase (APT) family kinase protein